MEQHEFLQVDVGSRLSAEDTGGDTLVAAAHQLDQLDTIPRSVVFLAEVVRAGGIERAIGLPEPLPTDAQATLIKDWLRSLRRSDGETADDDRAAAWLNAVADILDLRRRTREGTNEL
ncbi:hypothetical protein D5S17_16020 [Pseudonocardiaceae bacterium YIM PH 21723]|nr:hypothetical protein D5S17_16020 [Pseudonocardiaceae bacterium YIM PH 21723]